MKASRQLINRFFHFLIFYFLITGPYVLSWASQGDFVEINGDVMEYSMQENKITASGNVVIIHKQGTMTCDRADFYRDKKIAYAEGHVRLSTNQGTLMGDHLTFNFDTMTGDFDEASYFSMPLYGHGKKVSKVDQNKITMQKSYMTTCDLDKPHFRVASKTMDVYPKDKLVARRVKFMLGNFPILYLPRFTQDISGKEPFVTFTPGFDKQWGIYLLSAWRYKFNDHLKGFIHLDAREKKDIAEGLDLKYDIPGKGEGIIRTYYMNERNITSKRWFKPRPSPTIERERFKAEWRHVWDIDKETKAVLQYYKLSDNTILKEYFKRDYQKDSSPTTYFLLTKQLSAGILSFRTDKRVNRFDSAVERLPEIAYNLGDQAIANTNFYLRNTTTFSNLSNKSASPTEVRKETMRVNWDDEISYPFKVSILEFKPFVGGVETYYSKTQDPSHYNVLRGQFKTGSTLSTRFYRIFDTKTNLWGLNINRLRHVITPTASYSYYHDPTIPSSLFDSFDGIDGLSRQHTINFLLENKLQTKRGGITLDLLRIGITSDFRLQEHPGPGGFEKVNTDIEFKPNDNVIFSFDSMYDSQDHTMKTANFELYINGSDKWSFNVRKRWIKAENDEITAEWSYKINPKWKFRVYDLFNIWRNGLKEQEYSITRDLHCWEMDINFTEKRGQGNEIWLVFRLKAFPDILLDLGTSFNRRKAGSQSFETPQTPQSP